MVMLLDIFGTPDQCNFRQTSWLVEQVSPKFTFGMLTS